MMDWALYQVIIIIIIIIIIIFNVLTFGIHNFYQRSEAENGLKAILCKKKIR